MRPAQKAKDSTKDCKKIQFNAVPTSVKPKGEGNQQKAMSLPKATTSVKSVESILHLREFSNLELCPAQKAKDSTKDCKKFQTNTFFERNCQKEKTISKKQRFYQKLQQA